MVVSWFVRDTYAPQEQSEAHPHSRRRPPTEAKADRNACAFDRLDHLSRDGFGDIRGAHCGDDLPGHIHHRGRDAGNPTLKPSNALDMADALVGQPRLKQPPKGTRF